MMNRFAILILMAVTLTACDDRFRYPCQNPANWDAAECKRPVCAVNQTCPDMVNKMEEVSKGDVR
jgi:hypothetical protein